MSNTVYNDFVHWIFKTFEICSRQTLNFWASTIQIHQATTTQ